MPPNGQRLAFLKKPLQINFGWISGSECRTKAKGSDLCSILPAPGEHENFLAEGYLLWIGSESHPSCKLFRSQSLVLELPKLALTEQWHLIRIEKTESHLKFYLDGELKLSLREPSSVCQENTSAFKRSTSTLKSSRAKSTMGATTSRWVSCRGRCFFKPQTIRSCS